MNHDCCKIEVGIKFELFDIEKKEIIKSLTEKTENKYEFKKPYIVDSVEVFPDPEKFIRVIYRINLKEI